MFDGVARGSRVDELGLAGRLFDLTLTNTSPERGGRVRSRIMLAAALAMLGGCAADRGDRGSAGVIVGEYPIEPVRSLEGAIELMEHRFDPAALPISHVMELDPIAATILGDPVYDLTNVRDAVLTSDGRIAGNDRMRSTVLVFDSAGRALELIGRRGEGPGEFVRAAGPLLIAPDTLVLADWATGRVSRLVPGKGVVGSSRLSSGGVPPRTSTLAGVLPDGSLVAHSAAVIGGEILADTATRTSASVSLLSASGEVHQVASVPDITVVPRSEVDRRWQAYGPMLVRLAGYATVALWDSTVVVSSPPGYRLELFSLDGRPVRRIAADFHRREITPAEKEAATADAVAQALLWGAREEFREYEEAVPVADSLPAISKVMVGTDSLLWVIEAKLPGAADWYATSFDTDGRIVGRLHSTVHGDPLWFGVSKVLMRVEDENGVVSLRVHRIVAAELSGR